MSVKREILVVGFDKDGQADFGACADVMNLSLKQMNDLRRMIPVAICTMENMFRRACDERLNQEHGPARSLP